MAKIYKTKSKLFGYKIGLNNDSLYVAVPKKYFDKDEVIQIQCDGIAKTVMKEDSVQEVALKDKYKQEENYILYYFLWKKYD